MASEKWAGELENADRREQLKLVYDYIKFHIGLYLATPAALALIADGMQVKQSKWFASGLGLQVVVYFFAGVSAGRFMSKQVNDPWQLSYLINFERAAFTKRRRFMHHSMYWLGLVCGLIGLIVAMIVKYRSG